MKQYLILAVVLVVALTAACSGHRYEKDNTLANEGLLLNDQLVAFRAEDGAFSIKDLSTGKTLLRDCYIDLSQVANRDSLAAFCEASGKYGYYNIYTGKIAIPAEFRKAWQFSEGVAAVQKGDRIALINPKGQYVVAYDFYYYGTPLYEFVFHDGHCVMADSHGRCGVVDLNGQWIIRPDFEHVETFPDYAICHDKNHLLQFDYEGNILNDTLFDSLYELSFSEEERVVDGDGNVRYVTHEVKTGLFAYSVREYYGIMDADGRRITPPLYSAILAIACNRFRAVLQDDCSEVLINEKGEVLP